MPAAGNVAAYGACAAAAYAAYKCARLLTGDCDLALAGCSLPQGWYKGKVVWITGASSGIGEALAVRLHQLGARLVLSSRRRDALEAVRGRCGGGEDVRVLPLDLAELDALPAKAREAAAAFGRIDVLVNNGGVTTRALSFETDFAVDVKVATVDYLGQVRVTKAVLPEMMARGTGAIINISSVAGKLGGPLRSAYSGAKFALIGWMDALRAELHGVGKPGVTVCNVCPGPIATNAARNALTKDGSSFNEADSLIDSGMPVARCAELVLIAAANGKEEVWISRNPVLTFTYLAQYCPGLARSLAGKGASRTIEQFRKGKL